MRNLIEILEKTVASIENGWLYLSFTFPEKRTVPVETQCMYNCGVPLMLSVTHLVLRAPSMSISIRYSHSAKLSHVNRAMQKFPCHLSMVEYASYSISANLGKEMKILNGLIITFLKLYHDIDTQRLAE